MVSFYHFICSASMKSMLLGMEQQDCIRAAKVIVFRKCSRASVSCIFVRPRCLRSFLFNETIITYFLFCRDYSATFYPTCKIGDRSAKDCSAESLLLRPRLPRAYRTGTYEARTSWEKPPRRTAKRRAPAEK